MMMVVMRKRRRKKPWRFSMGRANVGQGDLVDRGPTFIWLASSELSTERAQSPFKPDMSGAHITASHCHQSTAVKAEATTAIETVGQWDSAYIYSLSVHFPRRVGQKTLLSLVLQGSPIFVHICNNNNDFFHFSCFPQHFCKLLLTALLHHVFKIPKSSCSVGFVCSTS